MITRTVSGLMVSIALSLGATAWGQCEIAELVASDGEPNEGFARTVGIDGTVAVVGAKDADEDGTRSGAAYVFELDEGQWVERQKLIPADPSNGQSFGFSVAVDGDTIIIGAPGHDDATGAFYVFARDGGNWAQVDRLRASDRHVGQAFGLAVAIDGAYAVIGATGDNQHGIGAGAVYLFERVGGIWTEKDKPVVANQQEFDNLGWSVDIEGERAVVGAQGAGGFGKAYILHRSGGLWPMEEVLVDPYPQLGSGFGSTGIAINGDWAMVGASGHHGNLEPGVGFVYVYQREGATWEATQLVRPGEVAFEAFGRAIAMDGNYALIGAGPGHDGFGSVRLHRREDDEWFRWSRHANPVLPFFGFSVAMAEDRAIVGSPISDTGAAHILDVRILSSRVVFDAARSIVDVSVTIPGLDPQVFNVALSGSMRVRFGRSCDLFTAMQATDLALAAEGQEFELLLPASDSITIQDVRVDLLEPGPPAPLEPCCGLQNGSDDWTATYEAPLNTSVSTGNNRQHFRMLAACFMYFLSLGTWDDDGDRDGGDEPRVVIPIDLTFEPDWGLGDLNPTVSVVGELTALPLDLCPADLDDSGSVDFADVLAILSAWGNEGGPEDLDGSGVVGFDDLLIALAAWGPCE